MAKIAAVQKLGCGVKENFENNILVKCSHYNFLFNSFSLRMKKKRKERKIGFVGSMAHYINLFVFLDFDFIGFFFSCLFLVF